MIIPAFYFFSPSFIHSSVLSTQSKELKLNNRILCLWVSMRAAMTGWWICDYFAHELGSHLYQRWWWTFAPHDVRFARCPQCLLLNDFSCLLLNVKKLIWFTINNKTRRGRAQTGCLPQFMGRHIYKMLEKPACKLLRECVRLPFVLHFLHLCSKTKKCTQPQHPL